jgi:hypothetical protein
MREIVETKKSPGPMPIFGCPANGFVFARPDPVRRILPNRATEVADHQVMKNLSAILDVRVRVDKVVKTIAFLSNLDDFPDLIGIYGNISRNSLHDPRPVVRLLWEFCWRSRLSQSLRWLSGFFRISSSGCRPERA